MAILTRFSVSGTKPSVTLIEARAADARGPKFILVDVDGLERPHGARPILIAFEA